MKFSASSPYYSLCLLLISMSSIQCSASLAKTIFPLIGPEGTTALRLMVSAIILLVVIRPWRRTITRQAWKPIILYGLSTGCMNMCFYQAISRIPLGVAVGLEFAGPMAVAMLSSRKMTDFVWLALAAAGLYLLLPLRATDNIDTLGTIFALCSGVCWGLYIVFGKKAGNSGDSAASVALGMLVGACFIFPFGLVSAGSSMFSPSVLPLAIVLGIFSSALPYGLEIYALKNLPSQTFGILMSLEPALAALSGFIFLQEILSLGQWLALGCIIIASIGATVSARNKH